MVSGQIAYLSERVQGAPSTAPTCGLGPETRFERIVERHHARLRRFASNILSEPDRVDDVLQEAYLKAYRRLPRRFEGEAHQVNWLVKVVFRCCLDELRSASRRRAREGWHDIESVPSEGNSMRMPIDRAFRSLSDDDRVVLLLVDLVGLGYPEVARLLDVPRGTVASRLSASRRRFRDALIREGVRDAGSH